MVRGYRPRASQGRAIVGEEKDLWPRPKTRAKARDLFPNKNPSTAPGPVLERNSLPTLEAVDGVFIGLGLQAEC